MDGIIQIGDRVRLINTGYTNLNNQEGIVADITNIEWHGSTQTRVIVRLKDSSFPTTLKYIERIS